MPLCLPKLVKLHCCIVLLLLHLNSCNPAWLMGPSASLKGRSEESDPLIHAAAGCFHQATAGAASSSQGQCCLVKLKRTPDVSY
jgi:hypothetical protein